MSLSLGPRLTRRRTLPSREEMRQRIYLLREDAQPPVYPTPLAPAGPLLHGVRAPPSLAPLVGPRLMPCCVAPEACGGLPVKIPVYPRLTGDNPLSGVRFFSD